MRRNETPGTLKGFLAEHSDDLAAAAVLAVPIYILGRAMVANSAPIATNVPKAAPNQSAPGSPPGSPNQAFRQNLVAIWGAAMKDLGL